MGRQPTPLVSVLPEIFKLRHLIVVPNVHFGFGEDGHGGFAFFYERRVFFRHASHAFLQFRRVIHAIGTPSHRFVAFARPIVQWVRLVERLHHRHGIFHALQRFLFGFLQRLPFGLQWLRHHVELRQSAQSDTVSVSERDFISDGKKPKQFGFEPRLGLHHEQAKKNQAFYLGLFLGED